MDGGLLVVHREDQGSHVGVAVPDAADRLQPVQLRHLDVDDHHVGAEPVDEVHQLLPVARLGDHLDLPGLFEDQA